jgi:hypothetical protein
MQQNPGHKIVIDTSCLLSEAQLYGLGGSPGRVQKAGRSQCTALAGLVQAGQADNRKVSILALWSGEYRSHRKCPELAGQA